MDDEALYKKFKSNVASLGLIEPRDKVIVGCSGGPDSVALLFLLRQISSAWGLEIVVAHLNHGLRPQAQEEADYVKMLCKDLGYRFYYKKTTIERKDSLEQQARLKRLEFFKNISQKTGINKLALGHNLDDLAETIMMRILKGTGLLGLQAIRPWYKIGNLVIVRPLLFIPKSEIIEFLKKNNVRYFIDSSNYSLQFLRNKVRHRLFPYIEKNIEPQVKKHLVNLYAQVSFDYDFLQGQALKALERISSFKKGALSVDLRRFLRLHPALQALILRFAYKKLKGDIRSLDYFHFLDFNRFVQNLSYNKVLSLPKGVRVFKTKEYLIFRRENVAKRQ